MMIGKAGQQPLPSKQTLSFSLFSFFQWTTHYNLLLILLQDSLDLSNVSFPHHSINLSSSPIPFCVLTFKLPSLASTPLYLTCCCISKPLAQVTWVVLFTPASSFTFSIISSHSTLIRQLIWLDKESKESEIPQIIPEVTTVFFGLLLSITPKSSCWLESFEVLLSFPSPLDLVGPLFWALVKPNPPWFLKFLNLEKLFERSQDPY